MKLNRYHYVRLEPLVTIEDEGQYPNSLLIEPWPIDEEAPEKGYTAPFATNAPLELPSNNGGRFLAHTLYLLLVINGEYHVFPCSINDGSAIPVQEEDDDENMFHYYLSVTSSSPNLEGGYPYLTHDMPEECLYQGGGEYELPEHRKMVLCTTLQYRQSSDTYQVNTGPVYVVKDQPDETGTDDRFILDGASIIGVDLTEHYVELADEMDD